MGGILLVLVGALLLAQTIGVPPRTSDIALGVLLALTGGALLFAAMGGHQHRWWAAIAGASLVGLGALAILDVLLPGALQAWSGTVVLGTVGVAFLVGYAISPARWWAIIPGGALVTLAVVNGLTPFVPHDLQGAEFLMGMALTFAAVAMAPPATGDRRWAWIVAAVFAFLGLAALASSSAGRFIWPALIIAVGVALLIRATRRPA